MGLFDGLINRFADAIANRIGVKDERLEAISKSRDYYEGRQKRNLKVKGYDDNLTVNFCGLVVDRSVSDMVGGGVEWSELEDAQVEYLDRVWDANKQEILLHRAALSAAQAGTGYIKILPDGIADLEGLLPRLVVIDPEWVTVVTDPEDAELVAAYVIEYSFVEGDKTKARKEITTRSETGYSWVVQRYIDDGGGKYVQETETAWDYPFPPIIHWQNLPDLGVYGVSDIPGNVLELQDKYNFVSSNLGKIIRYHAHPKTVFTGTSPSQVETKTGIDDAIYLPSADAKVANVEMQSDLASSMSYLRELRQSLFDTARSVDLDSIQDKVGALTNFGLRVLYKDALAKIDTKRELFGDMLIELNRRILVLAGKGDDGGNVLFQDTLPANLTEQIQMLQFMLTEGLESKQTAAEAMGIDWESEQERMDAEKQATDNIGGEILRLFSKGGIPQEQRTPVQPGEQPVEEAA